MDQPLSSRRVVVTGRGVVTSIGHDTAAFWASLVAGRCGMKRISLFDPAEFACQTGAQVRDREAAQHMEPKEARRNHRYTQLRLVAAQQAVAASGVDQPEE